MEKYESKQVQIMRPANVVYTIMSDFRNFTPILQDKVENWSATENSCSFTVKGFTANLHIVGKEQDKFIKVTGDDRSPFEFFFWMQLQEMAESDTHMKLVLHIKLNMMMKMMLGGKIDDVLNQMAESIAESFNQEI